MSWGRDAQTGLILPASAMPSTPAASRENVAAVVKRDIKQLLVDFLADRLTHAKALADGATNWRNTFRKAYGAFYVGNLAQADHVADVVYQFLVRAWQDQYRERKLPNGAENPKFDNLSPGAFLDAVHVETPMTDKEREAWIEDGWELEIAGSDEAMRKHYEGSARVRKGRDLGAKRTRIGQSD